jgi:hypothetical protein
VALLPLAPADLFREPDYHIAKAGDLWLVQKPGRGGRQPFTISGHRTRSLAESRRRSLPRVRLNKWFVRLDPATHARTVIADWTDAQDAREITADVHEILSHFGPVTVLSLLRSTPLYMARLGGASGYTGEEKTDSTGFAIYLDPFHATGRLHAASTVLHELTHVEQYRARGFHANRAAAVLPRKDFVLLGLTDELAAYRAEANLVRAVLQTDTREEMHRIAREAMLDPALNWPAALLVLLGFQGSLHGLGSVVEARMQVRLDLSSKAGLYWERRHSDELEAPLRHVIRQWYRHSDEWRSIAAGRSDWEMAEARTPRSDR